MGRLFRRMFDFKGMERMSLNDAIALAHGILSVVPRVKTNITDPTTLFINAFFGFVDGAFEAEYIPECKSNFRDFFAQLDYSTKASAAGNKDRTLWYQTRALKLFHPFTYYCYYSGKFAYQTF
jgi:hypothetical protein